ncbi:hypothetical protein [Mucilaginibacter sp. 10I4]|uniref:hypothetical protein n=1 Tax=Mucilaginibacter sp. 10I4 TaxID=3048580 RepID=UPI002B236671|nr:hypothetical protein [Mucilaginibacter sp. 10I4]MEB0260748.1 hypothetical protein [Mucilaginibacter sp. 10I4]
MSIFSFLGKGLKLVGKTALGVVGSSIGLSGLSNVFDKKTSSNVTPEQHTVAASLNIGTTPDPNNPAGQSIGGAITGLFGSMSDFFSGRTHVQADLHTEIGGIRDPLGYETTSGLPPWLLPVALGGIAILFLSKSGSSRRY